MPTPTIQQLRIELVLCTARTSRVVLGSRSSRGRRRRAEEHVERRLTTSCRRVHRPWVIRLLRCSMLVFAMPACAAPQPAYLASAASERAAWFVHREPSGSGFVDRVIECHEERTPPCVRFEVVGVRDREWYRQWVRQSAARSEPTATPSPSTPAPSAQPGVSGAPALSPASDWAP